MAGVQVLSYDLISKFTSSQRIMKILDIVKKGDVVMLEGRLTSEEESSLISKALANVSDKFTGVEIAFLDFKTSKSFFEKFRDTLLKVLAKDRFGITVIGPSKLIKEIKMDPNKLEIMFNK